MLSSFPSSSDLQLRLKRRSDGASDSRVSGAGSGMASASLEKLRKPFESSETSWYPGGRLGFPVEAPAQGFVARTMQRLAA